MSRLARECEIDYPSSSGAVEFSKSPDEVGTENESQSPNSKGTFETSEGASWLGEVKLNVLVQAEYSSCLDDQISLGS
jgi:hypothetical protein